MATPEQNEINAVIEVCLSRGWTIENKTLLPPDHRLHWAAVYVKSEHGISVPHWAFDELTNKD